MTHPLIEAMVNEISDHSDDFVGGGRAAAAVMLNYLDHVVSDHPDPEQMEILTRFLANVAKVLDIELENDSD